MEKSEKNQIEILDDQSPEPKWIEECLADPNPTLPMLLSAMDQLDRGVVNISEQQMVELGQKLFRKVDNYKVVEDEIKAQIASLSAQKESYMETKIRPLDRNIDTLERGLDRLQGIMKFYMEMTGSYQLPGVHNSVKLVERKGSGALKIKPGYEKPNSVMFAKFPDFVERTYTWKKSPIKDALKKGTNVELNDVAELTNSQVLQWTVNKKPLKLKEKDATNDSAENAISPTH